LSKWIDLRQTETKMINDPFYTLSWYTFHQPNCYVFVTSSVSEIVYFGVAANGWIGTMLVNC